MILQRPQRVGINDTGKLGAAKQSAHHRAGSFRNAQPRSQRQHSPLMNSLQHFFFSLGSQVSRGIYGKAFNHNFRQFYRQRFPGRFRRIQRDQTGAALDCRKTA